METVQRRDCKLKTGAEERAYLMFLNRQIDCVVDSVKPHGVFCYAGPLTVFISKAVRAPCLAGMETD